MTFRTMVLETWFPFRNMIFNKNCWKCFLVTCPMVSIKNETKDGLPFGLDCSGRFSDWLAQFSSCKLAQRLKAELTQSSFLQLQRSERLYGRAFWVLRILQEGSSWFSNILQAHLPFGLEKDFQQPQGDSQLSCNEVWCLLEEET